MESFIIYAVVLVFIVLKVMGRTSGKNTKKVNQKRSTPAPAQRRVQKGAAPVPRESSAMPHKHNESGVYDSYNKHKRDNSDGAMPHSHGNALRGPRYDSSKLPKGYILLNGEPVSVKDLENR